MKRNNFLFFSVVVFWIIGMAQSWSLWSRILLGVTSSLLLADTLVRLIKQNKGE